MANTNVTATQIENINQLLENIQSTVNDIIGNYEQYHILEQDAKTFQIIWSGYVTELEEIIDLLSKAGESIGRTTGINLAITTYNQQMTTKIMGLNKFLDEWVSNQDVLAQESYERAMAVERNVSLLQMVLIV